MGFIEVKLSEVVLPQPKQPGVGKYVLQLVPGAVYRQNQYTNCEELNLSASIVSTIDGDVTFAGRRVFLTYPDPTSISQSGKPKTWSAHQMKKLEVNLGEDAFEGEDPATYFNRVASNGHSTFTMELVPETRKNKETGQYEPYVRPGELEPRAVPNLWSVGPAA